MKKITILLIAIFATISMQSIAQNCTPDYTGYTAVPDTGVMLPQPLPNATVNVAYQQPVTIGVPSVVKFQGAEVPLNWIKFVSVSSSLGNTWTVVNSTGGTTFPQWAKSTWQCVTISGTPTVAGTDSVTVYVDGEVVGFGTPFPVSNQAGGKLAIIVQQAQAIGAEYIDNNVSVYPNPSIDGNYLLNLDQQYDLTLCDITGRVISSSVVSEGKTTLSLVNEVSGVYFIRLKNENHTKTIRIVKR